MVNFFSKSRRRPESYQGFSKYTDELNRYLNQASNNVAGVASTGISRSQSMTQGAGQAAMVALQRHNEQQKQAIPRQGASKQPVRRANSLTAASNRSNSMRTYTYHPKPSYTVGQALGSSNHGARRFNSLNSKSSVGSYNRPGARATSLTSQNSFVRSRSPPVLYEQDDEGEEDDITVTTKTTKVVDSQGRVLSITVETIKTFADGSTVTNTTTKNISRSNSRANSLNSQSMALKSNNSIRHNSMLSNGAGGSYNLSKIDEDLQDFDYNYELDHDILTQKGHGHPHVDNVLHELAHADDFHDQSLRLNHGNHGTTLHGEDFGSPDLHSYGGNESIRSAGLKSITSESSKPLKSILKKKNITDKGPGEEEGFADAVDELQTDKPLDITKGDSPHPYKSLSSPQFPEPPKFKVPQSPNMHLPQQSNRINTNTGSKRTNSLLSSPISKHDDVLSDRSDASNSIKFLEKNETIFYNDSEPNETEPTKPSDQDFYNIAMQVAMERVYGNKESQPQSQSQSPKLSGKRSMSLNSNALPLQDSKKETKTQELNDQGVNDNYVYQNHHKDFVGLSLRDNVEPKQTSRKERAKEEKKQQKSQLKEQKQKMKQQEKEESDALKTASKEQKKSQKAQKHGRFASLFGRRKSTTNDKSSLASGDVSDKLSNVNSQPTTLDNNLGKDDKREGDFIAYQELNHNASGPKGDNGWRTQVHVYQKLNGTNSGQDDESKIGDKFRSEEAAVMATYSNHENVPSLGGVSRQDNTPVDSPLRPIFNNEGSGSYSMKFPRNDIATENLRTLPKTGDNTELDMNSQKNQDIHESSTKHRDFQDMPGSMPGVDSSILRAIVNDDTEAGPLFDNVTDLNQKATINSSANIINDRTSIYSNDAEEKRKGKVLDPITVPVLKEIKSETTSIESQSNKNKGFGEINSAETIEQYELLDSDNIDYPQPSMEVRDDIEEKNGGSSQTLLDSIDNKGTTKTDITTQESNKDGLFGEMALANQDDIKEQKSNVLSNEPNIYGSSQCRDSPEPAATLENQVDALPVVADDNDQKFSSKFDDREDPLFLTQKLESEADNEITSMKKNVSVLPPVVNDTLEGNDINKTLRSNNKSQNLQTARPITDEVGNTGIANGTSPSAVKTAIHTEQLQSTHLPKSSFEHMHREESGSPVIVHNDHDVSVSESKPSKKSSKFKQKLFKYFVNSYNN